jgi:transposase
VANLIRLDSKARIVISNPMQTKAITTSKIKTDKVDALTLANLMATNYVPAIWEPDAGTIVLRRLVAYHQSICHERTATKNRIHAVLHRNLITYPKDGLFSVDGRAFLSKVSVPSDEMEQIEEELALLDILNERIKAIKRRIAKRVYKDAMVRRLMTITGIDLFTATTLRAAIGADISRFPSAKKLVSYFGLGCFISQSADRCYMGRITKRGNVFARSMLVQASQVVVKYPSPLRAFFQRLYASKGRNKAIVAVASKLTRIVWHMLTNKEDYRHASPIRTRIKMTRLDYWASGISKRGGAMPTDKGNGKKAEREYMAFVRKRITKRNIII